MKIKMMTTAAAVLGVMAIGAPMASAATCNTGTSQARDYSGTPATNPNYGKVTNADKLADSPDGGVVYGDTDSASWGYIGITGPHGFIEGSGSTSSGRHDPGLQQRQPRRGQGDRRPRAVRLPRRHQDPLGIDSQSGGRGPRNRRRASAFPLGRQLAPQPHERPGQRLPLGAAG